jgi:ABC-type multidrug transport system, ATPase component
MNAIEVDSLTKVISKRNPFTRATDERIFIDNVSFTAEKGEFIGILGTNGSGKTILLKLVCGLMSATSGTIMINGFDIEDRRNALKGVGCAIDTPGYYTNYTPTDMLLYNGKLRGIPSSTLKAEIHNVLEYLDLEEWKDVPLSKFSKGLMKKYAIASALLSDPDILILDEPSSGMDQKGRMIIQEILFDMKKENRTVIMSTHFQEVSQHCDKAVVLDHGRCVASGVFDKVMEHPNVVRMRSGQDIYLESKEVSDE